MYVYVHICMHACMCVYIYIYGGSPRDIDSSLRVPGIKAHHHPGPCVTWPSRRDGHCRRIFPDTLEIFKGDIVPCKGYIVPYWEILGLDVGILGGPGYL